ncbi:hypothetical protein MNBD_ALPHA05-304 [hydrothermal vent metagenome]|uniref:Uncharacterized protein n=1 Tax=hydrothermal vent metagenome TaxID=652676 RepID=A0A3B0SPL2_9ZZZZ
MREPPAGIVGNVAANRPILSVCVILAGLIALGVVGVRQLSAPAAALIGSYAATALYVVALPMALAALRPRRRFGRFFFYLIISILAAVMIAVDAGRLALPAFAASLPLPSVTLTVAALGLFGFFSVLAPLGFNVARHSVAAAFAAIIGAVGGAGYLAIEELWGAEQGAIAIALALTLGVGVGVSVGADFAKFFAAGAPKRKAAAAAGHSAVAIMAFSLLVVAAFFGVQTFDSNFGAIDWRVVWAGITAAAAAMTASLVAVTASLAVAPISEQAAVDENYRRGWFAANWRPIRQALPPTTASAASAIAVIVVIIALFEAGFAAPIALALFFALVWLSAVIAFVSVRTATLIVALLAVSAVLADYGYTIFGVAPPSLSERLTGLTFGAIALAHMTVSWRNAGEVWRNARDVTENALSDGLRRFLFVVGAGAASIFASAQSFAWPGGAGAAAYFLTTALISLVLAPVMMTAMSARFSRY